MTTTTQRAAAGELRGEPGRLAGSDAQAVPAERERVAAILACDLPNLGGPRDFLRRLMRQQRWREAYARRAITEYLRFCALAGRCGHALVPSPAVDAVWHLHLLETRHYWQQFCPQLLGRDLHHTPARLHGGDAAAFREQYAQTLRSYERRYGEPAPADLWPTARRPAWRASLARLRPAALLAGLLALLPGVAQAADRSGEGLWFWAFLFGALPALAGVWWWRQQCREPGRSDPLLERGGPDLAFLQSGAQRATDVVALQLLQRGLASVDPLDGQLRRALHASAPADAARLGWLPCSAFDRLLLPARPSELAARLRPDWQRLQQELQQRGLLCSDAVAQRRRGLRRAAWLVLLAVVAGFYAGLDLLPALLGLMLFQAAAVVLLFDRPALRETHAGRTQLQLLATRHARLRSAPCSDELGLAVGLFGVAVLKGGPFDAYHAARTKSAANKYDGGADGGCNDASDSGGGGGGDGGGSSCGGGCGGD